MATTTRPRPRSLSSTTTKLQTEYGNLYVTVSTDEDGEPFEVFGWLGKGGRPARCHRAGLPPHLAAPAPGHPGRGNHRPVPGHTGDAALLQHYAQRQERGRPGPRRRDSPHPQGPREGQGGEGGGGGGGSAGSEGRCMSGLNNRDGAVSFGGCPRSRGTGEWNRVRCVFGATSTKGRWRCRFDQGSLCEPVREC